MAYDPEARHTKYVANKKKKEEDDERSIQNRMRYNQNHDQQGAIDERNERNIHKQMLYDSNHDREIVRKDSDEANIRNRMRKNAAVSNNSDYQKYDAARKRGEKKARDLKRDFNNAVDTAKKSITKHGPGYQQTNPTSSGDGRKGGQMDREWKNHKWVSRERNQNGKWMYDYGGGTSGGNKVKRVPSKKEQAKNNLTTTARKSAERNTGREPSFFDRMTRDAGKAIEDAGKNLNRTLSDLSVSASVATTAGANFLKRFFG